jgi:hypothetical protein
VPRDTRTDLLQQLFPSDRTSRARIFQPAEQIVARSKRLIEQAKCMREQSRYTREMAVSAGARAKALMQRISEQSNLSADAAARAGFPAPRDASPDVAAAELVRRDGSHRDEL